MKIKTWNEVLSMIDNLFVIYFSIKKSLVKQFNKYLLQKGEQVAVKA